jgi:hypothetical protein
METNSHITTDNLPLFGYRVYDTSRQSVFEGQTLGPEQPSLSVWAKLARRIVVKRWYFLLN